MEIIDWSQVSYFSNFLFSITKSDVLENNGEHNICMWFTKSFGLAITQVTSIVRRW